MKELFEKIHDHYLNSVAGASFRTALTGGLWSGLVPEQTTAPYGAYRIPVQGHEDVMTNNGIDDYIMLFILFSANTDPEEVLTLNDLLITLYGSEFFTFSNDTKVIRVDRTNGRIEPDPDQEGWNSYVFFKYRIGTSL